LDPTPPPIRIKKLGFGSDLISKFSDIIKQSDDDAILLQAMKILHGRLKPKRKMSHKQQNLLVSTRW
jgi:hypothetical protein